MTFTAGLSFKAIYYTLQRQGHMQAAEDFLTYLNISREELSNMGANVSPQAYYGAWDYAQQRSGDDMLGLHVGSFMHPSLMGVLGYAVMNCPTVADAWKLSLKTSHFGSSTVCCEVEFHADEVRFNMHTGLDAQLVRPWVEMQTSGWLAMFHHITNSQYLGVHQFKYVHFRHALTGSMAEYERVLGCPVLFEQEQNCFVFAAEVAALPVSLADHNNLMVFMRQMGMDQGEESFAEQVRQYVKELMPMGMPDQEQVAEHFEMSSSTLKRRLKEEGLTYGGLCTGLRQKMARKMLAKPQIHVNDIAIMLGYTTPGPFFRAFKRWEGSTPLEYRRLLRKR